MCIYVYIYVLNKRMSCLRTVLFCESVLDKDAGAGGPCGHHILRPLGIPVLANVLVVLSFKPASTSSSVTSRRRTATASSESAVRDPGTLAKAASCETIWSLPRHCVRAHMLKPWLIVHGLVTTNFFFF